MENIGIADEGKVKLLHGEEHVCTWVAVEHKLALTVTLQSHKGKGSARMGVKETTFSVHPVLLQYVN